MAPASHYHGKTSCCGMNVIATATIFDATFDRNVVCTRRTHRTAHTLQTHTRLPMQAQTPPSATVKDGGVGVGVVVVVRGVVFDKEAGEGVRWPPDRPPITLRLPLSTIAGVWRENLGFQKSHAEICRKWVWKGSEKKKKKGVRRGRRNWYYERRERRRREGRKME